MKFIFLAFMTTLTFSGAFASTKETWTCSKNGSPVFTAEITEGSVTARLHTQNIKMTSESMSSLLNVSTVEFTGFYKEGHDYYDYRAFLMRDFKSEGRGQLVLVSDIFIDCLGNAIETEAYECTVK